MADKDRFRLLNNTLFMAIAAMDLGSLLLRAYLVLQVALSLTAGVAIFKMRARRATSAPECVNPTAQRDSIELAVGFGSILIGLLALIHFSATYGQKLNFGNPLFWSAAFAITWLLGQLASTPRTRISVVGALIVVTISARAEVWYSFLGGPIGVDPWYHSALVSQIVVSGGISTNTSYGFFPAMHALVAQTVIITGLSIKDASFLSVCLPFGMVPIFAFLVARGVFGYKSGLMAGVLVSSAAEVTQWGILLTPMTYGITLTAAVLYLLAKSERRTASTALVVLCTITLVVTHPLASLILVVFLGAVNLSAPILRFFLRLQVKTISRSGLFVFGSISILAYWMFVSGLFPFVIGALSFGLRVDRLASPDFSAVYGAWAFVYRLGYCIVLSFALVGSLRVLQGLKDGGRERGPEASATPSLLSGIWLFTLVASVLILGPFTALLPGRWLPIDVIVLAVFAGSGLELVLAGPKARKRVITGAVLVLVASAVMLSNPIANSGTVLPGELQPSRGFLLGEISAAQWIRAHNSGPFYTDVFFQVVFGTGPSSPSKDGTEFLEGKSPPTGVFVYRTELNYLPGFASQQGVEQWASVEFNPNLTSAMLSGAALRVYDNGAVVMLGF